MSATTDYWTKKHQDYSGSEWISKPTIFAEESIEFLPKQGKLLDLGAGQGQDSRFFAKRGFQVTALDVTEYPLEVLKSESQKDKLEIEIVNADIGKKLPFRDFEFDVVFSHLALHYFDDYTTRSIFNEIHRILKPDGIAAALFNTIEDPEIKELGLREAEPGFFETPDGIYKRYFSTDSLQDFIGDLFEPVLIDNAGRTYKDRTEKLIRFIGKRE